jgi:hypothetical protein
MTIRAIPLLVLATLLYTACATTGSEGGGTRMSRDEPIRAEEINMLVAQARSAYDLVERLRPHWLTSRGVVSVSDPRLAMPNVYMDGMHAGDIDFLRQYDVVNIAEIRYYTAAQASNRFGMGHPRGVIEIVSR